MSVLNRWRGWNLLFVCLFSYLAGGLSFAESSAERIQKAKKEGVVNFYAVWQLEHLQALKKAFNKRYPTIQVNLLRQGGQQMINRLDTEAKTGRNDVDVIIISDLYWQTLMDKGLVAPYCSRERKAFPSQFKDPKCRWSVLNINTHVIAYNTALVPKKARPKNLKDLLDPRWKGGKLVMDTTDDRWFTQTLDKWGEEKGMAFMKKLAAQKPDFRRGHTLMLQILAAGEYPVNVMTYGHNVEFMKARGAPIDWVADQPVTVTGGAASLAKRAPHPEAAKFFIDFLMSKEAQEVITRFNRIATRVDVPPNPPRLLKDLKMAPVKPELGRILPRRVKQFRKVFGLTH
ncbi:MAG: ABC transporter substrate-binding protein [Candidatus Binatia bacterium]